MGAKPSGNVTAFLSLTYRNPVKNIKKNFKNLLFPIDKYTLIV